MSHRPKKSLGQHFLVDGNLQRKIVEALDPRPRDEILEIGPGRGALTRHIAGRCGSLILVELDRDLAEALREHFRDRPEVRVEEGDILQCPLDTLSHRVAELKVVGNIPYNITSPLLFHLLQRPRPREILIMIQREVGDRVTARPGTPAFGALTVGVQSVARAKKVLNIPASAFRPIPEVDSVVLRLEPHRPEPLSPEDEAHLRSLTRAAFQWRRKQFQAILRKSPALGLSHEDVDALQEATGLDLRQRPETFSPGEFVAISRALRRGGGGSS